MTMSTPYISSSGNIKPQSTTTRSSLVSITVMLRPISPQPPSGTMRRYGSDGGAGTVRASEVTRGGFCSVSLLPRAFVVNCPEEVCTMTILALVAVLLNSSPPTAQPGPATPARAAASPAGTDDLERQRQHAGRLPDRSTSVGVTRLGDTICDFFSFAG